MRIPITDKMRRDLKAALDEPGAPTGGQIEYNTDGRVKRQTVSRIHKDLSKRWVEWEQWALTANMLGLEAESYLPAEVLGLVEPPPEWKMSEPLRHAIPSPKERRLIERALEAVLKAGQGDN